MSIITFTSDYGYKNHYIAAVKSQVLKTLPQQVIVDISHHVHKNDISHGAYILSRVFREFPEKTIHLVAVSSSGAKNNHVLVLLEGHIFIGPDNGIISLISKKNPETVQKIIPDGVCTFPAKDLYMPTAVQLIEGKPIDQIGQQADDYKKLLDREPRYTKESISGHVIFVDDYGNLHTNIRKEDYEKLSGGRAFVLSFGREQFTKLSQTYDDTEGGDCFALFNSYGFLEIGISMGNAKQLLGLDYDSPVSITFQ
jgi:hypothetical protein